MILPLKANFAFFYFFIIKLVNYDFYDFLGTPPRCRCITIIVYVIFMSSQVDLNRIDNGENIHTNSVFRKKYLCVSNIIFWNLLISLNLTFSFLLITKAMSSRENPKFVDQHSSTAWAIGLICWHLYSYIPWNMRSCTTTNNSAIER